jgi:hypothetical protein
MSDSVTVRPSVAAQPINDPFVLADGVTSVSLHAGRASAPEEFRPSSSQPPERQAAAGFPRGDNAEARPVLPRRASPRAAARARRSTPDATGCWHGREISLAGGAVSLLGRTDGVWRAPSGLRAIEINVPRPAVPVTDTDIDKINDQSRLLGDPRSRG